MEEGEDNSKLGETSCVTRFIRMLLSLVSYLRIYLYLQIHCRIFVVFAIVGTGTVLRLFYFLENSARLSSPI